MTVPNVDSLHQRFYQRVALSHPDVCASELAQAYDSIMKHGLGSSSSMEINGYRNILQTEIGQWLLRAEAAFNNEYNIAEFFDFKIINDNLEKAYSELKEYCLGVYLENNDDDLNP